MTKTELFLSLLEQHNLTSRDRVGDTNIRSDIADGTKWGLLKGAPLLTGWFKLGKREHTPRFFLTWTWNGQEWTVVNDQEGGVNENKHL
jgi:hypothetical protein